MPSVYSIGTEFLVNTTTKNSQYNPAISNLSNGGFVVTWMDTSIVGRYTIIGKIFDSSGLEIGGEFVVPNNTTHYSGPSVITPLLNGNFVVGWQDQITTGILDHNIMVQIFSANGTKIGSNIIVNTSTLGEQFEPTITTLNNGNFVVSWYDFSGTLGDSSSGSVKAQIFSPNGSRVGGEFLVNTITNNGQYGSRIANLADGGFVVTWNDLSATSDTSILGIKAQIFDAAGVKVGGEFLVNTNTLNSQYVSSVSGLDNGGFVISWTDASGTLGDSSGSSVKAQIFDASGHKAGTEFLVNSNTSGDQTAPYVTGLPSGRFIVSWADASGTLGDSSGYSTKAQIFDQAGGKIGNEFLVNTNTFGNQSGPNSVLLANNHLIITWIDSSGTLGDSSGTSVKAQIIGINNDPVIISNGGSDIATISLAENGLLATTVAATDPDPGTSVTYSLSGGADQNLFSIDRSTGVLTFKVAPNFEAPADVDHDNVYDVIVRASDGTLFDDQLILVTVTDVLDTGTYNGTAGIDKFIAPNSFDWAIYGLAGNDKLTGNAGHDTLYGGDGNDTLDGSTNDDALYGGNGNDTYFVDNTRDQVTEDINEGTDTVKASIDCGLTNNVEKLILLSGYGNLSGKGNGLNNTLTGNEGDNLLFGLAGNDVLQGGYGDDRLNGGAGKDVLTGGLGADTFVFDVLETTTNKDNVKDFVSGADQIELATSAFPTLVGYGLGALNAGELSYGSKALSADDHLIYNTISGALYYDADGVGGAVQVQIVTLSSHPHLLASDIVLV
jgi:hypothetical protein